MSRRSDAGVVGLSIDGRDCDRWIGPGVHVSNERVRARFDVDDATDDPADDSTDDPAGGSAVVITDA